MIRQIATLKKCTTMVWKERIWSAKCTSVKDLVVWACVGIGRCSCDPALSSREQRPLDWIVSDRALQSILDASIDHWTMQFFFQSFVSMHYFHDNGFCIKWLIQVIIGFTLPSCSTVGWIVHLWQGPRTEWDKAEDSWENPQTWCSPVSTPALLPSSVLQRCNKPSVLPDTTNCESGVKLASIGRPWNLGVLINFFDMANWNLIVLVAS